MTESFFLWLPHIQHHVYIYIYIYILCRVLFLACQSPFVVGKEIKKKSCKIWRVPTQSQLFSIHVKVRIWILPNYQKQNQPTKHLKSSTIVLIAPTGKFLTPSCMMIQVSNKWTSIHWCTIHCMPVTLRPVFSNSYILREPSIQDQQMKELLVLILEFLFLFFLHRSLGLVLVLRISRLLVPSSSKQKILNSNNAILDSF